MGLHVVCKCAQPGVRELGKECSGCRSCLPQHRIEPEPGDKPERGEATYFMHFEKGIFGMSVFCWHHAKRGKKLQNDRGSQSSMKQTCWKGVAGVMGRDSHLENRACLARPLFKGALSRVPLRQITLLQPWDQAASGKISVTSRPGPGSASDNVSGALWRSAIALTMESPRPEPGVLRLLSRRTRRCRTSSRR